MSLNTKNLPRNNAGGKSDPMEPGNYPARVLNIVDLGLQPQRTFKGQEKPPCYQVMITYEFPTEFMKDEEGNDMEEKPRVLSETFPIYSLNADKAKSTLRYRALDPKGVFDGDFARLVGQPCTVTVVQNKSRDGDRIYSNIAAVTPPMKGMVIPELINKGIVFSLDDPDIEAFKTLPEWVQTIVKGNLEYVGSRLAVMLSGAKVEKPADNPY